jgi:hypothetical protein
MLIGPLLGRLLGRLLSVTLIVVRHIEREEEERIHEQEEGLLQPHFIIESVLAGDFEPS